MRSQNTDHQAPCSFTNTNIQTHTRKHKHTHTHPNTCSTHTHNHNHMRRNTNTNTHTHMQNTRAMQTIERSGPTGWWLGGVRGLPEAACLQVSACVRRRCLSTLTILVHQTNIQTHVHANTHSWDQVGLTCPFPARDKHPPYIHTQQITQAHTNNRNGTRTHAALTGCANDGQRSGHSTPWVAD